MKRLVVLAAVGIVAGCGGTASAQTSVPLTVSDVNNGIRSEQHPAARDSFTSRPASPLLGRHVALSFPVVEAGHTARAGNDITWSYELGGQRLTLAANPESFVRFRAKDGAVLSGRVELNGFRTLHRVDSTRRERRENAFGAGASVEVVHDTIFGMALIGHGSLPAGGDYTAVLNLPAEEARSLVQSVNLVVEGTVRNYGEQQAVLCGSRYIEPTLDGPREIFSEICVLSVDVRRVAFVNTSSGAVLKEWISRTAAVSADELSDDGLWSPGNHPRIFRTVHDSGPGWAEVLCEVLELGVIYRCAVEAESSQGWGSAAAAGLRTSSVNHQPGFLKFRVTWGDEGEGVARLIR